MSSGSETVLLYCPYVERVEPHLIFENETEYVAWCQTCFMVHLIPKGDTPPGDVPPHEVD